MRLLNVHTLKFREFFESEIPLYCILSHRWGGNELSYKEFRKGINLEGSGYQKIIDFCSFVKRRKIHPRAWHNDPGRDDAPVSWVWIDTVCIDKRSSAELSEAINSMFKWYANAEECHVLLADVTASLSQEILPQQLRRSSWFSRGWTLQELLAPELCVLINKSWEVIGHVCRDRGLPYHCFESSSYGPSLSKLVSDITTIPSTSLKPEIGLRKERFAGISIAERMSWASHRSTTRVEDEAYCLLGIFGINMPLLYGEGRMAFIRLQEEIIKRSTDQSIFAWSQPSTKLLWTPILALSTQRFSKCGAISMISDMDQSKYVFTNQGLQVDTKATLSSLRGLGIKSGDFPSFSDLSFELDQSTFLLPLNCYNRAVSESDEEKKIRPLVIAIRRDSETSDKLYRINFGEDFERRMHQLTGKNTRELQFLIHAYPSEMELRHGYYD